jgi:hypothetical protein
MKRILLILCFWLVGIAAANQSEYAPISPENVANLHEVGRFGTGAMNEAMAWSEDGRLIVGGARGFYFYEPLESHPQFYPFEAGIRELLFADENLVFVSDKETIWAYELDTRTIRYELEGLRPLSVSHQGDLLAYEVDAGVQVLDIASGTLLYDLSYAGILPEQYQLQEYGEGQDNQFFFGQFLPDDSGVIIGWRDVA